MNLPSLVLLTTLTCALSLSWKEQADDRIEAIRKGNFTLTVLLPDAQTASNLPIRIRQTRHHFLFGVSLDAYYIGQNNDDSEKYEKFITDHFNAVTCENAMLWENIEEFENEPDFTRVDQLFKFAEKNNLAMRGHCLLWGNTEHMQTWLQFLSQNELWQTVARHLTTLTSRYKDKVNCWEVANEMLDSPFYTRFLNENAHAEFFKKVRRLDPETPLFTNEYGILNDDAKTSNYIQLIQHLVQKGAEVNGIGIQEHTAERFVFGENLFDEKSSRAPLDPNDVLRRLDALGKLGLPIHITELSFRSDNEDKKAKAVENAYRLLFSHPKVEAIFLWGFWEKNHWMGREAALVERNWRMLPAGKALHNLLLYEWNTMLDGQVDEQGRIKFRGFYGDYKIFVDMPSGEVLSGTAHFVPESLHATITLHRTTE